MYKIYISHSLILENGTKKALCVYSPYSNKHHYEEILVYQS